MKEREQQPNILFVYSDQHRADVLGCAGNSVVATPNLDRLASEGMRFEQAWTESPICQPARTSLLTGQFPTAHGILGNFGEESQPSWDTFPRALQQAGYETAVVGKTHYANWPMGGGGKTPPEDEWIKSFGYDHVLEEFDRYVHVNFETPYTRFLAEHGELEPYKKVISERFRIGDRHWEGVTSPLPQELDLTSFLASQAQDWLKQRSGSKPWFLNLAFVQPHVPLMADPQWAAHYADAKILRTTTSIPDPGNADWAKHIETLQKHSHSELLDDDFVLAGARQYYAMVSLIDQKVGDLLTLLEQRGDLDNTLIIYASDHGEMLGDHGLMAKMCFYKSAVRIPLIVRPPEGSAPRVHGGPVQAIDIAATVLDAGAAKPLDNSPARSLLPTMTGKSDGFRDIANSMIRLRPEAPTWIAASDGRYRLTYDRATGEAVEFFDLETDPDENVNGAADKTNTPEINRLWEMSQANLFSETE
jgi:arylsulfatase A-like enzyme